MANNNLQKILEISNRIDNVDKSSNTVNARTTDPNKLERMIEAYDKQVFGKYERPQNEYDPKAEMEAIQKRASTNDMPDMSHSKIPKGIIESIRNNPLNYDPSILAEDSRMTQLRAKLAESRGIDKVTSINKNLDERDKAQINEQLINKQSGTIDYSMIKMIVENVIDNKLNQLNENINRLNSDNGKGVTVMSFKNGEFKFLTENGDVYKCQMTYVGKNKRK